MKVVVISDTHNKHEFIDLPAGDVIVHAGDFSHSMNQALNFVEWYGKLDYKYKILIAGNHEQYVSQIGYEKFSLYCAQNNVIYLEDTSIEIEGIKFHGSPYSVNFCNWAFMKEDEDLDAHWDNIPEDTDVLIVHGPAYNILDKVNQCILEPHVGSKGLQNRAIELSNKKLKYLITGHIHEAYGATEVGTLTCINACIFEHGYLGLKKPSSFEI